MSDFGLWHAFTRRRRHRLVDLLLGTLVLASLAGGLASVSPVLSIALVVAVAGWYLVELHREDRSKAERRPAGPPAPEAPGGNAIDELENVLAQAPPIPLTDQVRVERAAMRPLVEAIRSEAIASGSTETVDAAQALVRLVADARPVPFTPHVRVNLRRARKSIEALRDTIG